ncbi:MAG: DNA gyrase inhibitor YacG [Pseudomonadota bacterium]
MTSQNNKPSPGDAACPICGEAQADRYKPFCSNRCANVDLHRWLSGSYAIPAVEGDDDRDAPVESDA